VQEWKLLRAHIVRHVSAARSTRGSAMSRWRRITLAYERLELE